MKIWLHRANRHTKKRDKWTNAYSRKLINRRVLPDISSWLLLTDNVLKTGKRGGYMSDLTESGYLSDSCVGVCSSAAFYHAMNVLGCRYVLLLAF